MSKNPKQTPSDPNAAPAAATAPTPKPARRPRTPKPQQPAWYFAALGDGKFRIIEADSPEAVAALIVTVRPATPQDFVRAGIEGVELESKPSAV